MSMTFERLPTVIHQQEMKPAALRIYQSVFPGCEHEDLREQGFKVHILDKEFGIDSILRTEKGGWYSIQEKYREHHWWDRAVKEPKRYTKDFTQEYLNGDGSPGEWETLSAQLYFYGWANHQKTAFIEWYILNVVQYKRLVEQQGGLLKMGPSVPNHKHGRSWFVPIPIDKLRPAWMFSGNEIEWCSYYGDKASAMRAIADTII